VLIKDLEAGEITAVVTQQPYKMAMAALEDAIKAVKGQPIAVKDQQFPMPVITKSNVDNPQYKKEYYTTKVCHLMTGRRAPEQARRPPPSVGSGHRTGSKDVCTCRFRIWDCRGYRDLPVAAGAAAWFQLASCSRERDQVGSAQPADRADRVQAAAALVTSRQVSCRLNWDLEQPDPPDPGASADAATPSSAWTGDSTSPTTRSTRNRPASGTAGTRGNIRGTASTTAFPWPR